MAQERILVVDDDSEMLTLLRALLEAQGFAVYTASSGEAALHLLPQVAPDLIILDVLMPGLDGKEVCQRIRRQSTVPILFLTAVDAVESVVDGLSRGADDYLSKPFHPAELVARIRAMLRRARMYTSSQRLLSFRGGELVINRDRGRVFLRGEEISLSPLEYNLLLFLAERAGHVLSPEAIHQAIWGANSEADLRQVKWYIWRLRQKIEADPKNPQFIYTDRGRGYYFAPD
ncbi:MAG: response regulator transcription factor [Anaerolineae bacterium]|nr:response regulator transcription factor [Anaerolineae bacterium]MDW7991013.1 response regulator transcription factor [Anaerolineae bacterium]